MTRHHLAWGVLISLTLAACADREDTFTPVLPPPSPELRQRAEAGDAAALRPALIRGIEVMEAELSDCP